jgi:hypothetical protein
LKDEWDAAQITFTVIDSFALCLTTAIAAFLYMQRKTDRNIQLFDLKIEVVQSILNLLLQTPLMIVPKPYQRYSKMGIEEFQQRLPFADPDLLNTFRVASHKSRYLFSSRSQKLLDRDIVPLVETIGERSRMAQSLQKQGKFAEANDILQSLNDNQKQLILLAKQWEMTLEDDLRVRES